MQSIIRNWQGALTAGLLLLSPLWAEQEEKAADVIIKIEELKKTGKLPKPTRQDAPVFPYEMSRKGIRGAVVVAFIIDTRGDVSQAEVIQTTNPGFNKAALDAVKKWKFKPGEKDGRKVNTFVSQRIDFNLEEVR